MVEKIKTLLAAAAEKRQQWELAAALGDSVSAKELKDQMEDLECQALHLMRAKYGLL